MQDFLKFTIAKVAKKALGTEGERYKYTEKFKDELKMMIKEKKQAFYKW